MVDISCYLQGVRQHQVGNSWYYCAGNENYLLDEDFDCRVREIQEICVGLRSVQDREETFWRFATRDGLHVYPVFEAARLVLPTVMARLLDAKADPNLRGPLQECKMPDVRVHTQNTPLHEVIG